MDFRNFFVLKFWTKGYGHLNLMNSWMVQKSCLKNTWIHQLPINSTVSWISEPSTIVPTRSSWSHTNSTQNFSSPLRWVFPKNEGTPKWMVYNGKPYFLMDDLGGKPTIFGNIQIAPSFIIIARGHGGNFSLWLGTSNHVFSFRFEAPTRIFFKKSLKHLKVPRGLLWNSEAKFPFFYMQMSSWAWLFAVYTGWNRDSTTGHKGRIPSWSNQRILKRVVLKVASNGKCFKDVLGPRHFLLSEFLPLKSTHLWSHFIADTDDTHGQNDQLTDCNRSQNRIPKKTPKIWTRFGMKRWSILEISSFFIFLTPQLSVYISKGINT